MWQGPGNNRGRKLRPGHFRTRNKIVGILNTEEGRSRARRSRRPQDTTGQAGWLAGWWQHSGRREQSSLVPSRLVPSQVGRRRRSGGGLDARCQVPDARCQIRSHVGRLVVGIPELMGSRDHQQSCECCVESGRVERTCTRTCRVVEQGDGSDETTGGRERKTRERERCARSLPLPLLLHTSVPTSVPISQSRVAVDNRLPHKGRGAGRARMGCSCRKQTQHRQRRTTGEGKG